MRNQLRRTIHTGDQKRNMKIKEWKSKITWN
jgi:hypothetical protein